MNIGKIKKLTVCLIIASVLVFSLFCVPVSAASSIVDISKLTNMVNNGRSIAYISQTVGDFIPNPNAVWYRPSDPNSNPEYEMHFSTGVHIDTGDTYTLTYDLYFPSGTNANTQIVFPGLSENYIAASASWEGVVGDMFFHWTGSITRTAGYSTDVLKIIPRGVSGSAVCVNSLKISVRGKDYTGTINNATGDIKANADKNTEKILGAGDGVSQPDFDGTNSNIDGTTSDINQIEGDYQIDTDEVQSSLSEFDKFSKSTDMNRASIQVKKWIERFFDDNTVVSGFLVAVMCLSLCFWVIGRKAGR